MENNSNLVEVTGLSKKYGHKLALNNLNLTLPKSRIIGLLGPNGSGKTTLIKIINGLLMDYEGQVKILGNAPGVASKAVISYLPDRNFFGDWMTVNDAVNLFSDFYKDFDKSKALEMLKRLGLENSLNQKIKTMSKGMIEKFQLSLTMSRNALLYVLDEPIGGVDPAARDFILDTILSNYNENGSILLSTHLITDVERIFDTIIFLKDGQVELFEEVDSVRERTGKSIDELFREVFKC